MSLVNLADGRVLVVNDAAAELFGLVPSDIVGRRAPSLWDKSFVAAGDQALAAMAHGAVHSYRGLRRISRPSGKVDVWLWSRTVELEDGAVAVSVLEVVGHEDETGRLIGTYFGPDAIEIAVGTVDRRSRRLADVRPSGQAVIDVAPEAVPGTDITTLVHPEDVERLMQLLEAADGPASHDAVRVRLRHGGLDWIEVQCVALPTPADEPLRVAFAPASPAGRALPENERLVALERQMLHIAAELHAVGDTRRDHGIVETRRPSLNALHPRQREIVDRLLRGERVATIAEAMFLSPSTVRNHLSKVFKIFGATSQASLLALLRSDVADTGGAAHSGPMLPKPPRGYAALLANDLQPGVNS